jgi:hypothetical protein
VVVPAPDEV